MKLKFLRTWAWSHLILEARLLDGIELTKCLLRVEHFTGKPPIKNNNNKLPNLRVCFCFCFGSINTGPTWRSSPPSSHTFILAFSVSRAKRVTSRPGRESRADQAANFGSKMSDYLQWRLFLARNERGLGPGRVVEKAPLNCSFSRVFHTIFS